MAAQLPTYQKLFEAQDPRFVEAFRTASAMPELAKFVERWIKDPRAWAHEQTFRYLDLPWDCPGHQPVIKRLFKWAEGQQHDELMAAFCTGCDRLVRRLRKRVYRYDWQTRTSWEETVLVAPRNTLQSGVKTRDYQNPRTGEKITVEMRPRQPAHGQLFSYHTRYYLRRRAWRYFRWMGHQRPQDYPLAIARALILYRDEDLAQGENLLDSWSFMLACFGEHPALEFGSSLIKIRPGRTLGELTPSPRFPHLWKDAAARDVLMLLVLEARSRPVRVWGVEMLRQHHLPQLTKLPAEELLELLTNPHVEVQHFAAELLERAEGLEAWPLSTWLKLLETENLTALETICRVMAEKVSGNRLTLADCVRLTLAEPSPVARLGFGFLRKRSIATAEDRSALVELSEAQCRALAGEIASWALPTLGQAPVYERDQVQPFFDALLLPIRNAAWAWLLKDSDPTNTAAYGDAEFWCRLLETPFDDVRQQLIDVLERRAARSFPRPDADALTPLWCSVLVGVHRGGRQKLKAIRQMTQAMETHPNQIKPLLPVLAVALRSIRAPEMREALAAAVGLMESSPHVAKTLAAALPEVDVLPIGETVW